jgi:peptidoglycan hydrolase-like protein with peptidoglycan-binding domain
MFLASKIGWAGIALTLLTTGMLRQSFLRSAAGSDSNRQAVAAFVTRNEISKMQETLFDKGFYRGKIDGVFGLRTRASIRAYQKAENLPITGEVDTRTAAGLGVRPESNWANSQTAGRPDGHSSASVAGQFKREKPSAGIRRAKERPSKTARKEVSQATAMDDNRGSGANNQQAGNEVHDQ